METGDGLLARIVPLESIPIQSFQILCAAATEFGNGIVEVTQRGSLQIRGLRDTSAQTLADIVVALGVGQNDGPPLLTAPLLGLDVEGWGDPNGLIPALQKVLANRPRKLSPKVSVLFDDGGSLHLDAVPADIRLRAVSAETFELSLAGNATTAVPLGQVDASQVVSVVESLLAQLVTLGERGRARDLVSRTGETGTHPCPRANPFATRPLKNGTFALGLALPFGHTATPMLKRVIQAAADRGATSVRPAPDRTLLAIGVATAEAAAELGNIARAEGFIVDATDPRRYIVACAGAPACASAALPTRQLAPKMAKAVRSLVGSDKVVHLSGCAKGCAHPAPAAVTIIGPNHWVLNGRASDAPQGTLSTHNPVADVERLCAEVTQTEVDNV